MKNEQIFSHKLGYITLAIILLMVLACVKEDTFNESFRTQNRSGNYGLERTIYSYNSDDSTHSLVAKKLSLFFKYEDVRTAFDEFSQNRNNSVILLADFMYNKVAEDTNLLSIWTDSTGSSMTISHCDFYNGYLKDYPGTELSFIHDDSSEFPDILNLNNFETVSVYSDIDTFPIYKDGVQIGTYNVGDEPTNKTILKLQSSDVYDVINTSNLTSSNSNYTYADLLNCLSLQNMINNYPQISNDSVLLNGCAVYNPLGGTKVFQIDSIYNYFNLNCGIPDSLPTDSGTVLLPRTHCDREYLLNGKEVIMDIECVGDPRKAILRSCDKWCSYWNKSCVFQVDIFIPTVASETEFGVLGSLMRVFTVNEKRLRKGWNSKREIRITEWLYEEGKHGDEWQYTWTGRHRKRGKTTEDNVSLGLSSKVGFKMDNNTVELVPGSSSISTKITRANKDCPLGVDIARYCRGLKEQMYLGDIEFKLHEL